MGTCLNSNMLNNTIDRTGLTEQFWTPLKEKVGGVYIFVNKSWCMGT